MVKRESGVSGESRKDGRGTAQVYGPDGMRKSHSTVRDCADVAVGVATSFPHVSSCARCVRLRLNGVSTACAARARGGREGVWRECVCDCHSLCGTPSPLPSAFSVCASASRVYACRPSLACTDTRLLGAAVDHARICRPSLSTVTRTAACVLLLCSPTCGCQRTTASASTQTSRPHWHAAGSREDGCALDAIKPNAARHSGQVVLGVGTGTGVLSILKDRR